MDTQGISRAAATIRGLAVDAVECSGTGHPGMPMGAADVAATLFGEMLRHHPERPDWIDRDRFVLSAGHGSVLLYALLHLSGYALPLRELTRLRRLGSLTPGHPEFGLTPGVETTTGPLGAGFATAVGMAVAESRLAAEFNTETIRLFDHATWVLAGDGCLMEGVASEAASLAGHLALGGLNVLYDSNRVSIEGRTDITFTENVGQRFESYGWQYLRGSAHDPEEIVALLAEARRERERPTIIELESIIGRGSPNMADTHAVHGATLGAEEISLTKQALGLPEDRPFYIDPRARAYFAECRARWDEEYERWSSRFSRWSEENPRRRARLDAYLAGSGPYLEAVQWPQYKAGSGVSAREASGHVIAALAERMPNFIGGSADLSHSNKTEMPGFGDFQRDNRLGRTIRFGVREHAMASIVNGIALHRGLVPFAATLFVFVDYMRPAMRLAALMKLPIPYVLTHDSIYLGGDGPTHQPIEHLNALRLIPNMRVLRPADPEETVEAWKMALERRDGPSALILSRQPLQVLVKSDDEWRTSIRACGAYTVVEGDDRPDVVVCATGSEVSLACRVAEIVRELACRVVSVISREMLFDNEAARAELVPNGVPVVVVEAGSAVGWERMTGGDATMIVGIDRFGESGRPEELAEFFGFTAERIARVVRSAVRSVHGQR